MKTLLLLFVGGILGYVHCQADHHPCDRLAVNIKTSATDDNSNRKGMDRHNQLIDLGDLLETPKGEFFITRASHRADLGNKYTDYCTGVTFGDGCGPMRYVREFTVSDDLPEDNTKNYYGDVDLAGKITMQLEALTYNIQTGKIVRIVHNAKLINRDDLIFQVDNDDSLIFTDARSGEVIEDSEARRLMIKEITQPFAINRLIKDQDTREVVAVVSVTCDEKWGWANYAGNIVSENIEGKYARQIEEAMFNLDVDHNRKIKEDKTIPDGQKKNDYDFRHVKPVSTTFPGDVQYTTLTP